MKESEKTIHQIYQEIEYCLERGETNPDPELAQYQLERAKVLSLILIDKRLETVVKCLDGIGYAVAPQ